MDNSINLLQCSMHPNRTCDLFTTDLKSGSLLLCIECIADGNFNK